MSVNLHILAGSCHWLLLHSNLMLYIDYSWSDDSHQCTTWKFPGSDR